MWKTKKPRKIYRLLPCPACDIQGVQSWLEDRAAEGWALWKIRHFHMAPPRRVRYRLQPADDFFSTVDGPYDPTKLQREAYGEFGWDYAARVQDFYIYRTEDPAAPELHTDPEIQAPALQRLQKRYSRGLKVGIAGLLVCAQPILRNFRVILEECSWFVFLAYLAASVIDQIYLFAKYRYYAKAIADLSAEKPLPPMAHRRLWRGLLPLSILLFIYAIVSIFWTLWHPAS